MPFARYNSTRAFSLYLFLILTLAACSPAPVSLPAASSLAPEQATAPAASPEAPERATAPAAPPEAPTLPLEPTSTPPANVTASVPETLAPSATPAPTTIPTATFTPTSALAASAPLTTTVTPTATPTTCFGSITGQVIADLNGNRQVDKDERGAMGATLFLKNVNGVTVGVYTTGNGQFGFPGVLAGNYNLSETMPPGYEAEGLIAVELTVTCGATLTQIFFNRPPGVASSITPTPTLPTSSARAASPAPQVIASNALGFAPFQAAPTYTIGGCGALTAPGLYLLTTSIASQWNCIEIASDNVTLDCQNNTLSGYDFKGYGIVVRAIGFILGRAPRNLEIRNCVLTRHKYGINVEAAENLYIHHNVAVRNLNDVDARGFGIFLGLVEGGGIRVNNTRGALISANRADEQAIGLDIRNSSGVVVRNNVTNANSAWGIHFYGVRASEISANVTTNNLRYCAWGSGVVGPGCDAGGIMLQAGSSSNLIQSNTITGQNGNGIFIKAHGQPCGDANVIVNNKIIGALYNGIEISFCRGNRILGNEIGNSLDGLWMGFAVNSEVTNGNHLHDMSNHGIISWNSRDNNISNNRIINSREGLYFYSSSYKKDEFWFVPGAPEDHVSRGNCLCANTLANNTTAAFHLADSIKNQMTNNLLQNNGTNFLFEGNTSGNIIQDNTIQGGAYNLPPPVEKVAAWQARARAATVYDQRGQPLTRAQFWQMLWRASPDDSSDLRWFKYKLRVSLVREIGVSPNLW